MRPRLPLAVLVTATLVIAACGSSTGTTRSTNATTDAGGRTVDVDMQDIAYTPDHVAVHTGETVTFVFHNRGEVAHDAFLGDEQAQTTHESEMGSMGDTDHGGSGAITVQPGDTGTLTHTFQAGDDVLVGCHETGHYAAGMKLTFDVV